MNRSVHIDKIFFALEKLFGMFAEENGLFCRDVLAAEDLLEHVVLAAAAFIELLLRRTHPL